MMKYGQGAGRCQWEVWARGGLPWRRMAWPSGGAAAQAADRRSGGPVARGGEAGGLDNLFCGTANILSRVLNDP